MSNDSNMNDVYNHSLPGSDIKVGQNVKFESEIQLVNEDGGLGTKSLNSHITGGKGNETSMFPDEIMFVSEAESGMFNHGSTRPIIASGPETNQYSGQS